MTSLEKASPLMLLAYSPALWAAFSKAMELYHPGEAGLSELAGRSKKTPRVLALQPKAAAIREDSP